MVRIVIVSQREREREIPMNDKRLWFTHKCRICSYMFTSEKDLLLHESTHERDDSRQQRLSCRSCSMSFDSNKQLTAHVCVASATEGPPTIQQQRMCKACGDLFATTNELYVHYVSRHLEHDTNNKANRSEEVVSAKVCVECGAVFSCWASYKVHLWKAHTGSVSSSSSAAVSEHHSFTETDLFKMNGSAAESFHEKAKSTEKPFKCSLCNWAFKYDFSLRSHMKVHERKQEELMQLLQNSESQSEPLSDAVIDHSAGESVDAKPNESSADVYKPVVFIRIKHDSGRPSGSELSTDGVSSGTEIACAGQDASHTSHRLGSKKIKLDTIENCETIPDNCVIGHELVTVDEDGAENILSVIAGATKSTGSDTGCETYAATTPPVGDEHVQQQPHRFVCKLCNFSCQYDFSYIAHLNQHNKLRELQIDDLQSHLIATETNAVAAARPHLIGPHMQIVRPHQQSLPASGKFSLGLVDDSGSVRYIKASHLLPTAAGTNYILLSGDAVDGGVTGHCSDDDELREAVTSAAEQEQRHHQRRRRRRLDDDVVLVDGASTINMVDIGSQSSSPGTNYEIDDGPHSGESSFVMALDSVIGEAYYVISEGDLRDRSDIVGTAGSEGGTSQHFVVMPSTDEHCDVVVVSEDVVVTGTVADDVIQSSSHDDAPDICDTHTCYFCNASFTCKASLQQHIQLHVE